MLPWEIPADFEDEDIGSQIVTIKNNQDIPTLGIWRFSPLYKINIQGQLMIYWVGYDNEVKELISVNGISGGKVKITRQKIEDFKQVRLKYQEVWKDYYRHPGKDSFLEKPMLPNKWEIDKTKIKYPVIIQPAQDKKLRRLYKDGNVLFLYIPLNVILDGYMKDGCYIISDFNTSERIPYEQRWNLLDTAIKQYLKDGGSLTHLKLIENYTAYSKEQILQYAERFKDIIIKRTSCVEGRTEKDIDSALYKSGRSNNTLKYKNYCTVKGIITAITEDHIIVDKDIRIMASDIIGNNKYVIGTCITYARR